MTFILLFFALAFGFFLFGVSEWLRLSDKKEYVPDINLTKISYRIFGVALILLFLFQGDFIKLCWEMVLEWQGYYNTENVTFSEGVALWKKSVSVREFWRTAFGFTLFLVVAFVYIVSVIFFARETYAGNFNDFVSFLDARRMVFLSLWRAFWFMVGIALFFQLGSFTMAIGYKLFY